MVRGLTSYLKHHSDSLSTHVQFSRDTKHKAVPLAVDGWGMVYELYLTSLPWASGGEYLAFYKLLRRLIESWRNVGLEPIWVFDGAKPPAKKTESTDRKNEQLECIREFYDTPETKRSQPQNGRTPSWGGRAILPPFIWHTTLSALQSLNVVVNCVADGEAEPTCAAIADKKRGYIFGLDTDLIIQSSNAPNCLGFAPADQFTWIKGTETANSLVPPADMASPTLQLTVYTAHALARQLAIPSAALPLFSAVVGNNYTPPEADKAMFPSHARRGGPFDPAPGSFSRWRIKRAADAIGNEFATAPQTEAELRVVVRRVVGMLTTNKSALLVNGLMSATLQASIRPKKQCCAAYPFCGGICPRAPTSTQVDYAEAQRNGHLHFLTNVYLQPNFVNLARLMEDPEAPAVHAATDSVSARFAAYAIVAGALGGLRNPSPVGTVTEYRRQAAGDVFEGHTQPLPTAKASPALSVTERLSFYLYILNSDTVAIRSLEEDFQPLAVAMRLAISSTAEEPTGRWRWSRDEVQAVVHAALATFAAWETVDFEDDDADLYPKLTARNSHLVAVVSGALANSEILAQALLLDQEVYRRPDKFMSGAAMHAALLGKAFAPNDQVEQVLEAVLEDMDEMLKGADDDRSVSSRKGRSKRRAVV